MLASDRERLDLLVLSAGLALATAVPVWGRVMETAVGPMLDWPAILGLLPPGQYYVAVSCLYVVTAVCALWYRGRDSTDLPTFRSVLVGGSLLALIAAVTADAVVSGSPWHESHWIAFAVALLTTISLLVAALAGLEGSPETTRRLSWAWVATHVPFAVWQLSLLTTRDGGLATTVTTLSIVAVVVLNLLWSVPLFLLGRSLRTKRHGSEMEGERSTGTLSLG
ncbi:MAG: hypothetical protein ABEJ42_09850 [Halobacteriaceae archaeon]